MRVNNLTSKLIEAFSCIPCNNKSYDATIQQEDVQSRALFVDDEESSLIEKSNDDEPPPMIPESRNKHVRFSSNVTVTTYEKNAGDSSIRLHVTHQHNRHHQHNDGSSAHSSPTSPEQVTSAAVEGVEMLKLWLTVQREMSDENFTGCPNIDDNKQRSRIGGGTKQGKLHRAAFAGFGFDGQGVFRASPRRRRGRMRARLY